MANVMIHGNKGQIVTDIRPAIDGLVSLSIDVINPSAMDGEKLVGGDNEMVTFFLTPEQVDLIVGSLTGQLLISKVKVQTDD